MIRYGNFRAWQIREFANIVQAGARKVRVLVLAKGWLGVALILGAPEIKPLTGPGIYEGFGPTEVGRAYAAFPIYSAAMLKRDDATRDPLYHYYDINQAFVAGYLARAERVDIST